MRVTSTSYYNSIYGDNNKLNKQLFDVSKQISSGQKIEYVHEAPGTFIDTLRLDSEIVTLEQTKSSALNAYKFSTQTDTTVGEIVQTIESLKVKLVNAASDVNSESSLFALAKEMRGLENHLKTLANTSINGQYIFSGTATANKPIDEFGNYQGNDNDMYSFLGSGIRQKYNITGSDLFLGEEGNINRKVTTNVENFNLSKMYPHDLLNASISSDKTDKVYITTTDTIRDLMGDTNTDTSDTPGKTAHFYIQGARSNGDTFKQKIDISMTATVDDLLTQISNAYGVDQVDVTLNSRGQIEIADKKNGSSKLDFHIVGAVDFGIDGVDDADVVNLNALQNSTETTDIKEIIAGTKELYIKEFNKSGLISSDPTITIQGLNYDQFYFDKQGATLSSNVPQIVRDTNEYATAKTKLVDVSGMNSLNGRFMALKGIDVNGGTYDITITLNSPASTFTDNLTGNTYNIYGTAFNDLDADGVKEVNEGVPSKADEITYQQLMDVVNMAVTGTLPTVANPLNDPIDYDNAVNDANVRGRVSLSADGKLRFDDLLHTTTRATLSLSDTTTNSFVPLVTTGNALSFQSNNALTIRDPKKNLFSDIDAIITSVELGKKFSDGSTATHQRNLGVQNGIQILDDLMDHVSRLQAEAGSYSKVLDTTVTRSDMLIISTKTLRSEVIDTDIAEATLRVQQLSLNYQALLSNIAKVSQLSLVNYL